MRINRREFIQMTGVGLPAALSFSNSVLSTAQACEASPDEISLPEETLHVLNRSSFGVHKNDIAAVAEQGLDEYLLRQISPDTTADPATEALLAKQYPQAYWPRKAMVEFYLGSEPKVGLPFGMPKELQQQTEKPAKFYQDTRNRINGGVGVGMMGAVPLPGEVSRLSRINRPGQMLTALREMTLYRAMRNPNQLYEVMVEFWGNHFSIDAASHKNLYVHKLLDDREVIRPHALSNFRTLLNASARSTAMLYYLDGVSNTKGIANENYARELMELHTLGVGNYSHHDVLNVARCFTGWTIDPITADFTFDDSRHDKAEKTVLNRTIPAGGGIEDGQKVLDILMEESATARHIATKLVRRFVADKIDDYLPLIGRVADAFGADGDIKAMLKVILFSDEFRAARDEKVKRPIEFMISSLRATSAEIMPGKLGTLVYYLKPMAQLPYNWPTPDGYPDVADYWVSANGLMHRWKFGLLMGNKSGGPNIEVDTAALIEGAETPREIVEALRANVLRRPLSTHDEDILVTHAAEDDDPDQPLAVTNQRVRRARGVLALMLNSIYFQLG